MAGAPRVAVIGGINVDLIVHVPRLPGRGESVAGEQLLRAPGGKGVNQAVAVARLGGGGSVSLIGRVGRDSFGHEVTSALRDEDVATRWVHGSERPTGAALIFVDEHGDNCVGITSGANLDLLPEDVPARAIETIDVLLAVLEVPVSTIDEALRVGRRAGVRSVLNTAPAQDARNIPDALLRHADVVVANALEAATLLGIGELRAGAEAEAARAIRRTPEQCVVITLGQRGAVALDGDQVVIQPTPRVEVVDTTGAGDAFVAAFAVAQWWDVGVAEALRFACAAGALATTKQGAMPAMPRRDDVERLLARDQAPGQRSQARQAEQQ